MSRRDPLSGPTDIFTLKWAIRQASPTGAAIEAVIGWQYPTAYDGYPLADSGLT